MTGENFEDNYDTSSIDEQLEKDTALIESISNGEFLEFTQEDYLAWYDEQRRIADNEFSEFEKVKYKTFDEIVEKYKILLGLKGNSYSEMIKFLFYSVIANQLKHNTFSMDSKKIDLRINILVQLKAGHGKKNIEYFCKRTVTGMNKRYNEPTSYHPEQFVGKIVVNEYKGETIYLPVLGTLAADFLVMDEAHALLTRKENEECLRYIRTALDPIGDNTIEKKQVNVPDDEKLRYNPDCTMLLLTQPISNVNEDLLLRGSFRRFVILTVNPAFDERLNARRESMFLSLREDVHNRIWERWIQFNKILQTYKNLKYISAGDLTKIDDYLDDLGFDANIMCDEILEFYNTSQFTIKQNIFKMILVRAIVEHNPHSGDTITINDNHIKCAIRDFHYIWRPQIEWIAKQLQIQSDKPRKWKEDVHPLIIEIIQSEGILVLPEIIERFYKHKQGTAKENTLKKRAYRAIQELEMWGIIKKEILVGKPHYRAPREKITKFKRKYEIIR